MCFCSLHLTLLFVFCMFKISQDDFTFFQIVTHLGKPKVVYPPSDCIGQFLLALLVPPAVTAISEYFQLFAQFGLDLRMYVQASPSSSHIE